MRKKKRNFLTHFLLIVIIAVAVVAITLTFFSGGQNISGQFRNHGLSTSGPSWCMPVTFIGDGQGVVTLDTWDDDKFSNMCDQAKHEAILDAWDDCWEKKSHFVCEKLSPTCMDGGDYLDDGRSGECRYTASPYSVVADAVVSCVKICLPYKKYDELHQT